MLSRTENLPWYFLSTAIRFERENIFTEREERWTSRGCVGDWRQRASQSALIPENWEAQEGSGQKQGMCVGLSFLPCGVMLMCNGLHLKWSRESDPLQISDLWTLSESFLLNHWK